MKMKITRNQLRFLYRNIYQAEDRELEPLRPYFSTPFYASGVCGWNYDVAVGPTGSAAVTTGYRGMFGKPLPERARDILAEAKAISESNHTREEKDALRADAARRFWEVLG